MNQPKLTMHPQLIESGLAWELYAELRDTVDWDSQIQARLTASFGEPYDDSGIAYKHRSFPARLEELYTHIDSTHGFMPTNCLLNFYPDGRSRMGFHSDATHNLEAETGVAIVSLGDERVLSFRRSTNHADRFDFTLPHGSLMYMTQETQRHWQHAVRRASNAGPRISATFRRIVR
jgi:alkylated DNA repair dioxygenase AlkB